MAYLSGLIKRAMDESLGLLQGKRAVITGAARERSIGRTTAELFAAHGCRCALLDLPAAAGQPSAAEAAAALGDGHMGFDCDVTDSVACKASVDAAAAAFSGLDIVVNNAGYTLPHRLEDISAEDLQGLLQVHLYGCLFVSQAAIPYLRVAGGGSIVNMSSISAVRGGGIFGGAHYAAAKAAVIGLTRAAAREFAPDNIRVNALAPSMIDTNITGGQLAPEQLEQIKASVPLGGRIGQPSEVAGPALFLASSLSSYVTGIVMDVTGGSHIG